MLVQYLYQKRISEGGRWPTVRYIVWLLVPLQGQKAITHLQPEDEYYLQVSERIVQSYTP